MDLYVVIDKGWGIGCQGSLLAHIPEDLRHFRQGTLHKTMILGRKTLESFPHATPLPKRKHLLLTHEAKHYNDRYGGPDDSMKPVPLIAFDTVDSLLRYAQRYEDEHLVVIGGGEIYRTFLPYCTQAHVTRLFKLFPQADTFFQNLDSLSHWCCEEQGERQESQSLDKEGRPLTFRFELYRNRRPLSWRGREEA